ncbi:MAG: hotdog fold thioesterase [Gammaproteobacteria bacterium]|nr:hotdog fold thioesterase [Gammaproteobacteria bacterium]
MNEDSIWKRTLAPEEINAFAERSLVSHLDIRCTEVADESVTATMPVDERTRQPYGLLHGGASVALAETLASIAGTLAVRDDQMVVGVEINANHVRQVRSGIVTGRARPVRLGSRIQVWNVEITDEHDRLVCVSRVTLAVLARPESVN